MKKHIVFLLCLMLLAGCGDGGGTREDGRETLGSVLSVEEPGHGFSLLDNNSILTMQDTYLATWVSGKPIDYVTAGGDEAQIYEAEIFLLLQGCKDAENAQIAINEWMALANDAYNVSDTLNGETHNGRAYTILTYTVASETNPYSRGAGAYAVYENYAVSAELACLDSYAGDTGAILRDFLDGCRYADTE